MIWLRDTRKWTWNNKTSGEMKMTWKMSKKKLKKNWGTLKKKIEELEVDVDLVRKELTMKNTGIKYYVKFEKRTEMLDEILSKKRSPLDKARLGYENNLKTKSSTKENTQLPTKGDEGGSTKCVEELQEDNISNWNRRFEF